MIKISPDNSTSREPLPRFLRGLKQDSLLDLSWTDPELGVSNCAWWPEEDQSPALGEYERYGAETLTPDHERRVVVVAREIVPWSDEDIAQDQARAREQLKAACEKAITDMIQAEVDAYNKANGLSLKDIHSCGLYAQVDGYSHQEFCQAVWAWNVQVWETARQVLGQVVSGEITITKPEEGLSLMPDFYI